MNPFIKVRPQFPHPLIKLSEKEATIGLKQRRYIADKFLPPNYEIKEDVIIEDVVFEHSFDWSSVKIEGSLRLINVQIYGRLLLHSMEIGNELKLENVTVFGSDVTHPYHHSINLMGTKVGGRCALNDLTVDGDFSARSFFCNRLECTNLECYGEVSFQDARIQGKAEFNNPQIFFKNNKTRNNKKINGALVLSGLHSEGDTALYGGYVHTGVNFDHSQISGDLYLLPTQQDSKRLIIGGLSGRAAKIKGQVLFQGIKINGDARLDSIEAGGGLFIVPSDYFRPEISGDLTLSGCRMNLCHIQISGLILGGSFDMLSAETGPIAFGLGALKRQTKKNENDEEILERDEEIFPCSAGRILIKNSQINGWLSLPFIQVTGTKDKNEIKGIYIDQSEIKGDFRLWLDRAYRDLRRELREPPHSYELKYDLPSPWERNAVVIGPVQLTNCQIGGYCQFTRALVSGSISMRDSEVKGDVLFLSVASSLNDEININPIDRDYLKNKIGQVYTHKAGNCAQTKLLEIEMLRCDGDVDLTGLCVCKPEGGDYGGTIRALNIKVDGDIKLFDRFPPDVPNTNFLPADLECYAFIPGSADFTGAQANRLVITSHEFDKKTASVMKHGINLSRSKFHIIEIPYTNKNKDTGIIYPQPLDMAEFSVDSIKLLENFEKSPSEDDIGMHFSKLLEGQDPFMRSPFRVIEQYLVNRGYERAAEAVYRTMHRLNFENELARKSGKLNIKESSETWPKVKTIFEFCFILSVFFVFHYLLQNPVFIEFSNFTYNRFQSLTFWHATSVIVCLIIIVLIFIEDNFIFIKNYLWENFLGYGTQPIRPLIVIGLLWLFSLPVYLSKNNFEQSLDALASEDKWFNEKEEKPKYKKHPPDWSVIDALAVSLRYHAPIIPIDLRNEWDLSNESPLYFKFFDIKQCKCSEIDPETYGETMYWINWVFWSLFLILVVRRLIRPSELGK